MQAVIAESIPVAILCLSFFGLMLLFKYRDWVARKTPRKNPLTSDLLRGPGESLREKIFDMTSDIVGYMVMLTTWPVTQLFYLLGKSRVTKFQPCWQLLKVNLEGSWV